MKRNDILVFGVFHPALLEDFVAKRVYLQERQLKKRLKWMLPKASIEKETEMDASKSVNWKRDWNGCFQGGNVCILIMIYLKAFMRTFIVFAVIFFYPYSIAPPTVIQLVILKQDQCIIFKNTNISIKNRKELVLKK